MAESITKDAEEWPGQSAHLVPKDISHSNIAKYHLSVH